ncbi:aspartate aminotransferase family protein [Nonomuraea sp. NEAU-A123]|uniref:aspartate aminotransferase family protein n=1 Tax=Nonomuraea sp. NEAU-A123 TaxID=2839649 RepID=UPI001BE3D5AC|nr:glutamate-1-semialdehyde 2,1-aminomutase [Nonomuraea sp. NEAU-A123]MBT2233501.1 glutamate-1-semialdehyde 2,1-aminomutase [Nonomuraea sp. NEAU-A123]
MTRTLDVSRDLYTTAQRYIAGGVSSDARRMAGVPLYVDRAAGARLWDVDGNTYLDYVLGQGPALLGHCPPAVVEAVTAQVVRGIVYSAQHAAEARVAERLCAMVPSAERVRFNTVGSEAVHAAWRLARGFTGRPKILKFEGHYHGWLDPVLYSVHPPLEAAGPADRPAAVPGTAGQPEAADLVVCPWNDLGALSRLMDEHAGQIAAVVTEPVLCNTGAIEPDPGYLQGVRELCDSHGSLLIFDEIITGFRLAPGGAQEYLGVSPDLSVFGKAMAGGMQVSALAGRAVVMDAISSGKVAHAGTFNSHPVGIAAAEATLRILDEQRDEVYGTLYARGRELMRGLAEAAAKAGVPMLVDGPGPVFQIYFTEASAVRNYRDFAVTDRAMMGRLHAALLDQGVNMVPRGLWFLSTAHTEADVAATVEAFAAALNSL